MGETHHEHHDHEHGHSHDHGPVENREQIIALLDYMCKHNEAHEAELSKIAEKLSALHEDASEAQVREAMESFSKGNAALRKAHELITK